MRLASVVVVGNDYLADRAYSAGAKRVEYLPTVIDLDRYEIRQRKDGDVFTIGWLGTPITTKYLNQVASALGEVASKRQVRVIAVGAQTVTLEGVQVDVLPWSEDTEVERIHAFDVGIMPLPDEPWEHGKCGYKLIQYMACGVPVIASPVGVNRQIVEQGSNGFLASTHVDWVNALLTLVDNRELAWQMGQTGRAKVERRYCLQVTTPRLMELMFHVCRGGAS
jgi:glycosyltransferase involved in cell wall biosynthesis